uniref:Ig-like domain-containing protein n=1 Tax=Monopterus albus TaxID=43700 RepID=A0A3Q3JPJ9_MONAL
MHQSPTQHRCVVWCLLETTVKVNAVYFCRPSISMSPADEVTWGQDVSFTCSNSAELQSILKKTSSSFNKTQMSHSNSAAFSIPTVDFDKEGSYQCQYEKIISGQTFSSHLSDSVKLSVTGM